MTALLKTLPNGLRLLAVPMPHVQSASVGVFLRVGSRDESPHTNGISHVLEHMAFKGTASRSVQEINLDAERLGADVNAFTSKDTTAYFMSGLGKHADRFLAMTADIVLNSTFPQAELERELEVIRQEAIEYEEDPEESSGELLDRAIWGEHPMGMPVIARAGGDCSIRSNTARTSSAWMDSIIAIVSCTEVIVPCTNSSSTARSMVA